MNHRPSSNAVFRLTTLWALCESGLGGWMHALQLPFTGFFVGGFAVILICLIGWYSQRSARSILQATFLVILAKAMISPQSPPPAYIAVAFQGVMGAVLLRTLAFQPACIILGIVAMAESALQKILIMMLIFGNSLWKAIDAFFNGIIKELHLPSGTSFSFWIIIIYTAVYAVWGCWLGYRASVLPAVIDKKADDILAKIDLQVHAPASAGQTTKKPKKTLRYICILACIMIVYLWTGYAGLPKISYILLRTAAVLAFFLFILNPALKWGLRKLLIQHKHNPELRKLMTALPGMRSYLRPAYELAKKEQGWKRFTAFILTLIVAALYTTDAD